MTYDDYKSLNADDKMQARAHSLRNIALASGFDQIYDADSSEVIAKRAQNSALRGRILDDFFGWSVTVATPVKTTKIAKNARSGQFITLVPGPNFTSPSKKRLKKQR